MHSATLKKNLILTFIYSYKNLPFFLTIKDILHASVCLYKGVSVDCGRLTKLKRQIS